MAAMQPLRRRPLCFAASGRSAGAAGALEDSRGPSTAISRLDARRLATRGCAVFKDLRQADPQASLSDLLEALRVPDEDHPPLLDAARARTDAALAAGRDARHAGDPVVRSGVSCAAELRGRPAAGPLDPGRAAGPRHGRPWRSSDRGPQPPTPSMSGPGSAANLPTWASWSRAAWRGASIRRPIAGASRRAARQSRSSDSGVDNVYPPEHRNSRKQLQRLELWSASSGLARCRWPRTFR